MDIICFRAIKAAKNIIWLLLLLMLWSNAVMTKSEAQTRKDYSQTIKAIARDIVELQSEFPQLKDFSPDTNINLERLSISYQFHTHRAEHPGGWTAGVPNPDDDGIWFYIDLHEADSQAQIHTQPVTANLCLADKRVSFLILEGGKTSSIEGRLSAILKKHGTKLCEKH